MSDLVEFVAELPERAQRRSRWAEIRAALAGRPGEWALIHAPGGYPRQRLAALGCEVRSVTVNGEKLTYARWPSRAREASAPSPLCVVEEKGR